MNFILITAAYVSVAALGVGIFLWGKPSGNSLFDRLYRLVCINAPWALKKALEKCFGPRAPAFLDWLYYYICFSSNPIVQVFYLLVVVGGFITFVANGFPHIPESKLISNWHRYTGLATFLACVFSWWRACSTDPGTVTALNVDRLCEVFKWDDLVFSSQMCRTCNVQKPARSKHCPLCGICVARFDHHCIWVNNCIGLGNHKWFLAFLFSHLVLCTYGVFIGLMILYERVETERLFEAVFVDPVTRERHKATMLIVFQYMLAKEGMIVFIGVLAAIMGVVLCGFFLWHLHLVRTGCTTNELSKWSYLRWALKKQGRTGKERLETLKNVYNNGLVANFREILFNTDVHRLGFASNAYPESMEKKEK